MNIKYFSFYYFRAIKHGSVYLCLVGWFFSMHCPINVRQNQAVLRVGRVLFLSRLRVSKIPQSRRLLYVGSVFRSMCQTSFPFSRHLLLFVKLLLILADLSSQILLQCIETSSLCLLPIFVVLLSKTWLLLFWSIVLSLFTCCYVIFSFFWSDLLAKTGLFARSGTSIWFGSICQSFCVRVWFDLEDPLGLLFVCELDFLSIFSLQVACFWKEMCGIQAWLCRFKVRCQSIA